MSLKHFHVFFIVLAVLCTLGFGAWALFASSELVGTWGRIGGVISILIGAGLVPYGMWFVKKSKRIII